MDAAAALVRKYDDGKASNGAVADDDEEDEEDDEYEDEEGIFGSEQLFETPLDKLDSYQLFSQVVQGKGGENGIIMGYRFSRPFTDYFSSLSPPFTRPSTKSWTTSTTGNEHPYAAGTASFAWDHYSSSAGRGEMG